MDSPIQPPDSFQLLVELYKISLREYKMQAEKAERDDQEQLEALHYLCKAILISPKANGLDIELPPAPDPQVDRDSEYETTDDQVYHTDAQSSDAGKSRSASPKTHPAKRDRTRANAASRLTNQRNAATQEKLCELVPDAFFQYMRGGKELRVLTAAAAYIRTLLAQKNNQSVETPTDAFQAARHEVEERYDHRTITNSHRAYSAQGVLWYYIPWNIAAKHKISKRGAMAGASEYIEQLRVEVAATQG